MLVLSRKVGESVVINGNITLTVVAIEGSRIRLGVHAPREISIHRSEILEQIKASEVKLDSQA